MSLSYCKRELARAKLSYTRAMNSNELRRWLQARGCTFHLHRGGSGHVTVRLGDRKTQLPMHGGRKELGKGLVERIKKDLGLN